MAKLNHSNMQICCSRNIFHYYQSRKLLCSLMYLWKLPFLINWMHPCWIIKKNSKYGLPLHTTCPHYPMTTKYLEKQIILKERYTYKWTYPRWFQLFLLIYFDELNLGFLKEVEHALVGSCQARALGGSFLLNVNDMFLSFLRNQSFWFCEVYLIKVWKRTNEYGQVKTKIQPSRTL